MAMMSIQRIVRSLLLALVAGLMLALPQERASAQLEEQRQVVAVLELDGIVSPATADYLIRGLAQAQSQGAALIVVRIDTPGGLDTSMRQIIRALIASPVPVVAWVGPGGARAASAGTFILYAAHIAAMAPGTNVGAATPIELGGGMPFDRERPERKEEAEEERREPLDARSAKLVNDAAAYIRGLADLRGRNAEWAEAAVREGVSLQAREALEKNVIDLVVSDIDGLLAEIDGRTIQVAGGERTLSTGGLSIERIEPDWRTELLGIIAHPNVAFILLAIGMYGLIFEFASPGMIVPGVIGAISLLLGLFALNVMPVDYTGVALMLLGVAFMVAEAFAPSFGILGLGGSVAFAVGAIMAFDTDVPGYQLSIPLVIGLTATTAGLVVIALTLLLRTRWRRVETGAEALIGAEGRVLEWSGDRGQIMVYGERWQAHSTTPLVPGQPVEVAARHGFMLQVRPGNRQTLKEGDDPC
jgi:membrane-bound serine protease (ClpP class)